MSTHSDGINRMLTKSLELIDSNKDRLDEDDIEKIISIIVSFNLNKNLKEKLRTHLDILDTKKRVGGPGRGNTALKEQTQKLEDAVITINKYIDSIYEYSNTSISELILKIVEKSAREDKVKIARLLGESEFFEVQKSRDNFKVKTLEDVNNIEVDKYYEDCSDVLKSLIEGLVEGKAKKRLGCAKAIPMWTISVIEICDRVKKLQNQKFISPIGLARNYFIHKLTGSRLAVDVLGATDGSGKYDTITKVEEASADLKTVTVFPADVHITADNEQVLSGNYRIYGNEAQRKLHINVINNWMVSYCETNGLGIY